jgi:HEAT repeat protein
MKRGFLIVVVNLLVAGCGGLTGPTKQVETPAPAPGPQFISTSGGAPPRPIYDYNVAPAQYSLKPLEQWTEQEAAADALGRIGPSAIPQLIELLKSPEPDVRLIAAQVLARMGSDAKDAVPHLIPLLKDRDERIRKAAARTLGRIGPDAAAAVPELMQALLEESRPGGSTSPNSP